MARDFSSSHSSSPSPSSSRSAPLSSVRASAPPAQRVRAPHHGHEKDDSQNIFHDTTFLALKACALALVAGIHFIPKTEHETGKEAKHGGGGGGGRKAQGGEGAPRGRGGEQRRGEARKRLPVEGAREGGGGRRTAAGPWAREGAGCEWEEGERARGVGYGWERDDYEKRRVRRESGEWAGEEYRAELGHGIGRRH